MFEAALARALPPGCVVANVYSGEEGDVRVRLGLDEVAAMAKLRDDIILGTAFEDALPVALALGTARGTTSCVVSDSKNVRRATGRRLRRRPAEL